MLPTNREELEKLLFAGRIAKEAREHGIQLVQPGAVILDVVEDIEAFIIRRGGRPAFPVNIGIDSVAAHFTPSSDNTDRFPSRGIVKVDVGVHVDGYVADTAATVDLGGNNQALVSSSKRALEEALPLIKPGASIRLIGGTIEKTITASGYRPVTNLMGHSIERYNLHAGFNVPNTGSTGDATIPSEIVIAVEPFATGGRGFVVSGRNGNIFSLVNDKKLDDEASASMLKIIRERFSTLPFAERWLSDEHRHREILNRLVRRGAIHAYQVLLEAGGGQVSQWEHTIIVDRDSVTATSM